MIQLIALLLAGFLSGFLLRKRKLKWVPSLLTGSIWVLLFLLGLEIGANPMVMEHLQTIGWLAAVLAAVAVLGSVLMA